MSHRTGTVSRRAFTLIELLVVMGLLAIVLTFALPAFNSVSRAGNLTNGGYMVEDAFKLARQMAVSQNRRIIIRFYKTAGEVGLTKDYRAFRLYVYDANGNPTPAGPLKKLPAGIIMPDDIKYSTILTNAPDTGTEDIPGASSASYSAVEFGPDGSLKLDPDGAAGDRWFVTIKVDGEAETGGLPGKNFITVMLDPVTGRTKKFQP
jgi:uncharacterized protein (TIGR02596 family)